MPSTSTSRGGAGGGSATEEWWLLSPGLHSASGFLTNIRGNPELQPLGRAGADDTHADLPAALATAWRALVSAAFDGLEQWHADMWAAMVRAGAPEEEADPSGIASQQSLDWHASTPPDSHRAGLHPLDFKFLEEKGYASPLDSALLELSLIHI